MRLCSWSTVLEAIKSLSLLLRTPCMVFVLRKASLTWWMGWDPRDLMGSSITMGDFTALSSEASSLMNQIVSQHKGKGYSLQQRQDMEHLAKKIEQLSRLAGTNSPTEKELGRRNQVVRQLEDNYAALEKDLRRTPTFDSRSLPSEQASDPWAQAMQLRKSQDKALEALTETVDSLSVFSINIDTELSDHNTMLDGIEKKVDANQRLTTRLQSRMVRFVEKSSDSCLGCIICGLLGLLG
eukprot:CAMPEP_0204900456 /NCGR_PEP_ID=MMETSP1397-20131031/2479_1 /ASSEMBLY_ACC=CAM_ASM_000891 /TAXON_ID=49980 /ORGANISM="Climacostomum Climacostomum virens, Strain Stock W-24" /LENGTH=238 /DNA_ID=CAMNT_0052068607 /DNA_START=1090 /DNA_END=1802 /DNA_ORIENTATION=-